ncbi:MAG: YebC/PmpR family DNA-binding transcriptional regulator [Planctomycetota bacterium]|nr:YebC/PmpR family DNA-binding transcriptional regulator [Planctomycetota bacterium]
MAGHSHWANIAHKKAVRDARKGKIISKLARLIYTAVKEGKSGKPDENPRLRLVLEKCRAANMSKEVIQRNIDKALGSGQGYEPMIFEGFGPGGVAVVVEAMTDNPGRTGPEVRNLLEKHGAKLAKPGAVSHLFQRKGVFMVEKSKATEEQVMEAALEAGAEDVIVQDTFYQILSAVTDFVAVGEALQRLGIETSQSEILLIPETRVVVDADAARRMLNLIERLEEHEDVQNVYSNIDVSAETAVALAKD